MASVTVQLLRNAFAVGVPPSGALCEQSFFHSPEAKQVCEAFRGRRWDELDVEFLLRNYDAIYFFSDHVYRYYLPAFLRAIVDSYDSADHLIDEVVASLTPPDRLEPRQKQWGFDPVNVLRGIQAKREFNKRVAGFTLSQQAAIICCLKALLFQDNDQDELVTLAKSYWEERVDQREHRNRNRHASAFKDRRVSLDSSSEEDSSQDKSEE